MVCLKQAKGCLPQILLGAFLNIFAHLDLALKPSFNFEVKRF